jgi:hypothetical protein
VLLSLLFCSQFVVCAHASGGSKVTTFHIGEFGPKVCDLDVHFSWDSDIWKIGEKHEVGFSFEVKNINSNVVNLTLNIREIIVRLETDKVTGFDRAYDILDEDVSNILTELVWRMGSSTIMNTPRSFSFDVKVPEEFNKLVEDSNVELYYLVKLGGNSYYREVGGTNLQGGGQINEYVSNKGTMSGGIEDPVWVTAKAVPSFPWTYVVIALVGVGVASTVTLYLVRNRRLKKLSTFKGS